MFVFYVHRYILDLRTSIHVFLFTAIHLYHPKLLIQCVGVSVRVRVRSCVNEWRSLGNGMPWWRCSHLQSTLKPLQFFSSPCPTILQLTFWCCALSGEANTGGGQRRGPRVVHLVLGEPSVLARWASLQPAQLWCALEILVRSCPRSGAGSCATSVCKPWYENPPVCWASLAYIATRLGAVVLIWTFSLDSTRPFAFIFALWNITADDKNWSC